MEEDWRTVILDRWDKMTARSDAAFDKIMSKLEILLQQYNCSPISSHGAANSPKDMTTEPLKVNLLMEDEFRSSATQIDVPSVRQQILVEEELVSSESRNNSLPTTDGICSSMEPLVKHSITGRDYVGLTIGAETMAFSRYIVTNPFNALHKSDSLTVAFPVSLNDDASSDEIGVSAKTCMMMEGNVVSLPLFGDQTYSFATDASLICTYPYDPGPLDSPPLNKVSNICDSFQLDQEVFTRSISQFDDPIALQVGNMLRELSISNVSIITHAFCHMVLPLITVGGFIDFGTSASYTYQLFVERLLNITFSCNMTLFQDRKTLGAKIHTSSLERLILTLDTVMFACDNGGSLIVGIQSLASLWQDYFDILVECKDQFYGYFIGFASEISVVTLALTKLVDNGVYLFKSQQMNWSEKMVHASFTQLALIVSHVTRLEYPVPCTYLVNGVPLAGLVYGIFWWLNALDTLVDGKRVLESLLTNEVRLYAFMEVFLYEKYGHVITCKNLPHVDGGAANSIVSITCKCRRDTSILVANFGIESAHIVYVTIQHHLNFLEEFSLVYHSDQVVFERWLHVNDSRIGDILWKVCLIFSIEEHLSMLQEVYTTNMFYLYHVPGDGWTNNNKDWCELDYGTKRLVTIFQFYNLNQGPLFHELIPYMIFSRCMLPCDKYTKRVHVGKATLFNIFIASKPLVITVIDLEDKIIFRGVGNDMIYVVLVSCLMTKMLYNEETIGNNKDVEVEKLGKSRDMRINRFWCCYNNDNNRFLVYEIIPNGSLMSIMNGKKSLFDSHYNDIQPIVIDVADGLVYLHDNYVLPIGHTQMRFNKVLTGVFEEKVAGIGVSKIVTFISKGVESIYVTMKYDGYVSMERRRKKKKWDPGEHLDMYATISYFKFKQWDPEKTGVESNFHNLEDKVVFYGDGIVMKPKDGNILETSDSANNDATNDEVNDAQTNKPAISGNEVRAQQLRKGKRIHKDHSMWKEYVRK